ncbi:CdaR family protein [Kurthia sibirica]|nr:CdaR family protein [Kurthia sibirica]GEK35233.1 CdaA regulatory protein CdaR [Kurthia sibirica]
MDKYIDTPWILRITALALAVLMFFSVRPNGTGNNVDTTTSGMKSEILQDIPVELRYDDSNFVVTGVPQTVNVKITGPIGIVITTQSGRNAKVVVNVKDKPSGEHVVKFIPEGFSDKLEVEVEPKTVKIMVEERITKDVKVEPEINENQLEDGKYVKSMTTEPQMVTVSGAKSAIESISYVKATVSADKGVNKTFDKTAGVKIFDRDLNILNVDVEPKTVKVKVEIGAYNRSVPLSINQKGKPARGYVVDSLTAKTKNVTIYGSKSDIDQIQQLSVEVDVTDIKKSSTYSGKIVKPTGVTSMSLDNTDVKVKVVKEEDADTSSIKEDDDDVAALPDEEEQQTKTFKNLNIRLSGLDVDKFNQEFISPKTGQVDVKVEGEKSKIDALSASDLSVYVDAAKISEGITELPIKVDGPAGITTSLSLANITMNFTEQTS